jgi:adenine/guanine phosphoribosyltransferase-like PRPP-binding protein
MYVPNPGEATQGDIDNLHYALPIIQEAIDEDRPKLFNLADQVTAHFPDRKWDTIISDASRGILIGNFLTRVLAGSSLEQPTGRPTHLPIANSRLVGKNRATRKAHGASARAYLAEHGVRNALVVTETVGSGKSMKRLCGYLRSAGITSDCAVLASSHSQTSLRRKMHMPNSSELYTTSPTTVEARTAGSVLAQGIGVETIVGIAEPQPSRYAWPLVGFAAILAYDALADEYISQSQTS